MKGKRILDIPKLYPGNLEEVPYKFLSRALEN